MRRLQDPRGFMAKLSDFGLSMKMAAHDGQVPGIKYGTVQYLAPEVLSTHIMTKRADVYSFGIIMWEVWHSRLFAEFYNIEKKKRKPCGARPALRACPRLLCVVASQHCATNDVKRVHQHVFKGHLNDVGRGSELRHGHHACEGM